MPTNRSIFAIRLLKSSGQIFQMYFNCITLLLVLSSILSIRLSLKMNYNFLNKHLLRTCMLNSAPGSSVENPMELLPKVSLDQCPASHPATTEVALVQMRLYDEYCPPAYGKEALLCPNSQHMETLDGRDGLPRAVLTPQNTLWIPQPLEFPCGMSWSSGLERVGCIELGHMSWGFTTCTRRPCLCVGELGVGREVGRNGD